MEEMKHRAAASTPGTRYLEPFLRGLRFNETEVGGGDATGPSEGIGPSYFLASEDGETDDDKDGDISSTASSVLTGHFGRDGMDYTPSTQYMSLPGRK